MAGMRAIVSAVSAPIMIGGPWGSAGRAPMSASWNEKYRPSKDDGPSAQSSRIASMLSARRARRVPWSIPAPRASSGRYPWPTPSSRRPGDMASRVATCSAISTGLWYGNRKIVVAT